MSSIYSVQVPSIINSFEQALLYGIYITTFVHCLRWPVHSGGGWRREKRNLSMLIVSVAIFLLQTAALAASFKTTLMALNLDVKGYDLVNTINSAIEYTTYQIVDAVLIYRCWVVYHHSWRIICLPAFFWISSVALSNYNIYNYASALVVTEAHTLNRLRLMSTQIWDAFFACNIAINLYATTAIVYRIVPVARISMDRFGRLHQTWRIVAESGALYTLSSIIFLVSIALYGVDPSRERYQIFLVVANAISITVAGVAFNLILIRVNQQRRERVMDQEKSSDLRFVNDDEVQLSTIQFHRTGATDLTLPEHPSVIHSNTDYHRVQRGGNP
ncbi:hypothetical protein AX15_002046 [Amanita polypyramis BW_CC]|nr:hypothetical protein AX15_002046 [Amanita polypyramis BW_CC]